MNRFLPVLFILTVSLVLALAIPSGRGLAEGADSVAATPAASSVQPLGRSALDLSDSEAAAHLLGLPVQPPDPSDTTTIEPASLVVAGHQILVLRDAYEGHLPKGRVEAAKRRIVGAFKDPEAQGDTVHVKRVEGGIEFHSGSHYLVRVTRGDVDTVEPTQLALEIATMRAALNRGIELERTGTSPIRLLIAAGLAAVLTIVALAGFRLLEMFGRRWREWLKKSIQLKVPAISLRGFEVLPKWQLAGIIEGLLGRIDLIAAPFLLYGYFAAVFSLFPWTNGWAQGLLGFAVSSVLDLLRGFAGALPGLGVVVIIFIVFRWLIGMIDRFFEAVIDGNIAIPWIHPDLARPSQRLIRIALWLIAIVIAYPNLPGSDSQAVQGVSILLGVMVSLGSTGLVGNILAGFVLTYSRSFKTGDRVLLGGQIGQVQSLGVFSTKMWTIRNEEITIPNGLILNGHIINYSRLAKAEGLILHTTVTIGYGVDWRKVHALLIAAAKTVENIEPEPEPWVFQTALNDNHVSYELNAPTKQPDDMIKLYSDLHAAIQDAFAEAGIEILSPAYQALRDANSAVLPAKPTGPRPAPGGFRMNPGSGA